MRFVRVLLLLLSLSPLVGADESADLLVLLPIQGTGLTHVDQTAYEAAVTDALSQRYIVYSGPEVAEKLQQYARKKCDTDYCIQQVVIQFQGDKYAQFQVLQDDQGAVIRLEIRDAFTTDKVLLSKTESCANCNRFQVVEKIKDLFASKTTPVAPKPELQTTSCSPIATQAWEAIKETKEIKNLENYLQRFNDCDYAFFADLRIKELRKEQVIKSILESINTDPPTPTVSEPAAVPPTPEPGSIYKSLQLKSTTVETPEANPVIRSLLSKPDTAKEQEPGPIFKSLQLQPVKDSHGND